VSTSPTDDPDVPEADGLEQSREAVPGPVDVPPSTVGPGVPEADALEQSRDVPPPDGATVVPVAGRLPPAPSVGGGRPRGARTLLLA
jgi:hypothetical protein